MFGYLINEFLICGQKKKVKGDQEMNKGNPLNDGKMRTSEKKTFCKEILQNIQQEKQAYNQPMPHFHATNKNPSNISHIYHK